MERTSRTRRGFGLVGAIALAAGLLVGPGCSDRDVASPGAPPVARMWIDDGPDKPVTSIRIAMAEHAWISLTVRDADGGQVRVLYEDVLDAGQHSFVWNGRDDEETSVASGAYWAVLTDGAELMARAMMLIK